MKPSFGWRGFRYAKDGYTMLSRMEETNLPSFCKHCRNLGLGRCLQKTNRHIPNLHPNRWTFLKLDWNIPMACCWFGDAHWYDVACIGDVIGCESDCCRPKESSDWQMAHSGCLGSNRNEECHRLNEHVRFSRRCTLHCGCSLLL